MSRLTVPPRTRRAQPSGQGIRPPSQLQKQTFQDALTESVSRPGQKVQRVGLAQSRLPRGPVVQTKRGPEPVIQQMTMETTLQRTPRAEYIAKTLTGVDVARTGATKRVEVTSQQIDPEHGTESSGTNLTVTKSNTLSITAGGKKHLKREIKKRTIKSSRLGEQPNMNPHHVSRMVTEEIQDVEKTLRMVPPDLLDTSVDKFPMRKNVQALRLSFDPVSMLSESIAAQAPTADEVDVESPPEALAQVIDAVEKGAAPAAAPTQIFNSLFPEVPEERMNIGSVAPGPLEDVVVPTSRPPRLIGEILTDEMSAFFETDIENKTDLFQDDFASENKIEPVAAGTKELPQPPKILEGELPPWEDATVVKISSLAGADPIDLLDISDIADFQSPADLSQELSKGIEYFVDADTHPYENRIQLRGSKPPKWFPGYMYALPHWPELVRISRNPSEVLHAAWRAVQPQIFPEDSILTS